MSYVNQDEYYNPKEFCDLEFFENNVIKENNFDVSYYILSEYFHHHSKDGTFLIKLSIFDDKKRGTIDKDKKTVKNILDILMNPNLNKEGKSYELAKLKLTEKEKKE